MELKEHLGQYLGKEIIAFCGQIKYRGILEGIFDDGFITLRGAAVMNPGAQETFEFDSCVLNVSQLSGIVSEEAVGRGAEAGEEFMA